MEGANLAILRRRFVGKTTLPAWRRIKMKLGFMNTARTTAAAAAMALTSAAFAMVIDTYESFTASAAGTAVVPQGSYYTPAVAGAVDGFAYTFAGNALGFPANPLGGTKFVGGTNPGTPSLIRMQKDNAYPATVVKVEFDVCGKYAGTIPGTQNLGSFSFQDSTLARFFIALMVWVDPATCANWSQQFNVYDAAGLSIVNQSPGAEWAGLNLNNWYKQEVTVNMATNQITEVAITNNTTGVRTAFAPPAWYLTGGAAPTLPAPTAFRLFVGGTTPGNTLGYDNVVVAGNPSFPSAHAVLLGQPFGGSTASLNHGDNNWLFLLNDEADSSGSLQVTGTSAATNAANAGAAVEIASDRSDLTVFIKMRNKANNQLVLLGSGVSSSTDKLHLVRAPAGTWSGASGDWEVVIDTIPQADLEAADGWGTRFDRVTFFGE